MSLVTAESSRLTVPAALDYPVFHEVFDAEGQPRPAWKQFADRLRYVQPVELSRRTQQAQQLLTENGVTFNVFQEGRQSQRPWSLDLLPIIISSSEWDDLSAGLTQRARVLNRIIADCHGPRELIQSGTLPPEILFANPGFSRQFVGLPHGANALVLAATELARGPDGTWRVMADRADAPAGVAFALENRIIAARTIPQALHEPLVRRLAPFFLTMQNAFVALGRHLADHPRIVLLSPGSRSPYYFEDVYLARYLGYSLVEGADLAVRDDRVYLKTLAGLVPIDVIVSRGVERGIDPLELGGGELHGIPGLLKVIRDRKVVVANLPGCGLVESPIFMAFLPQICQRYLREDLLLPSIPTWWCGNAEHMALVRERFDELVIKPAFQASGSQEIVVRDLEPDAREALLEQISLRPIQYVAQELIARSAVPVLADGTIRMGHAAIRAFLSASADDEYQVMPGGLVRYAPTADPMELSIAAGIGSKDLWVLADNPVPPVTLLTDSEAPVALRRTSAIFPSRVADDLFWFGQSLDRADFLSRLLRAVIERLTTDSDTNVPELPWLIRAVADQGQLEPGYAIASFTAQLPALAEDLPRVLASVEESRGLAAAISEMDRLASLERLWMSPDTARKVRETAIAFRSATETRWSDLVDVLEAINDVILNVAAVSGLIHDGMVRGPAWRLLDIGRRIERAKNLSCLIRSMTPAHAPIERTVLKAMLEIIDCRMTYRSRYFDNVQQNAVLDLCLTDETCPRSLAVQLVTLADHVDALPGDGQSLLRTEEKRSVMIALHAVRMIAAEQLAQPPTEGLQSILIDVDRHLQLLSDVVTRKYLLHSGIPRQIESGPELPQ